MQVEIREEPVTILQEYAAISIAFEVTKVFDVEGLSNGAGEFVLTERVLDVPYSKNYDAIDGEHPTQWPQRFDMSTWAILVARADGQHVGGATVALNTPELEMLEGRRDLALLWDIRVSPEARRQAVGSALFRAVETWARAKDCRQLKVETQNINVPACRFYERQGCVLAGIVRSAYPSLPGETQLLWSKTL